MTAQKTKSGIIFKSTNNLPLAESDLEGLHDALTGTPLDKSRGLHRCQACQVYYHRESYQILKESNAGRCLSCQSTDIQCLTIGATESLSTWD